MLDQSQQTLSKEQSAPIRPQKNEQICKKIQEHQQQVDHRASDDYKQVKMIQKHIRACITRVKLKIAAKKLLRRKKIFEELIQTEENYIRDLGFIISDFKMRLLSSNILTGEECNKLFSNVDEIRKLHQDFFTTLYNHYLQYKPYLIIFADILKIILFFRIYVEYLNNFPVACELIEQFRNQNPAFKQFLYDISHSSKYRFLGIEDYLVKPVQRLPKYILLLKEILKNTQSSHPDYQNISKALQKFEQVNQNNNDKLTEISNSYKLIEIVQMLKLPQGTISPGVEFVLEECVQILNLEQNYVISNCVMYLLNNAIIVARRYGCGSSFGAYQGGYSSVGGSTRNSSMIYDRKNRISHTKSTRYSSISGIANTNFKERLEVIVPIKHGTSFLVDQNMCIYKNSLTIQSVEGETCTFICESEEDKNDLRYKLKKQIDRAQKQALSKLKMMFKTEIKNETFLKNIAMLQLVPDVNVLGTTERNDKMLKYTVYIVEVKIKMVRQKIFVRFSELLELEKFVSEKYKQQFILKQALISSSWIRNHHQKIIEERKMNIQRFLKQLLSKPDIITNGAQILSKLGLPIDFYELPKKIASHKGTESFLKKSSFLGRNSTVSGRNSCFNTTSNKRKKMQEYHARVSNYRLSVFQQQKIEEQQEQQDLESLQENQNESPAQKKDLFAQSQVFQSSNKPNNSEINPKSSSGNLSNSNNQVKLTIQDLLKANQIDLGHYTRYSDSLDLNMINMETNDSVEFTILIPSLVNFFSCQNGNKNIERDSSFLKYKKDYQNGFQEVVVNIKKTSRIQNVVSQIAKKIKLKYFKDFRIVIEKEYSHRVLDDDEIVHKVLYQVQKSSSVLVFKKKIFIDLETEQKQMKLDRQRLKIIASQIIVEIKKGKYRLSYAQYLKFSVLAAIVFQLNLQKKANKKANFKKNKTKNLLNDQNDICQPSEERLRSLAKEAKDLIFPKYTSLSQTEEIWYQDFKKTYKILLDKLLTIGNINRATVSSELLNNQLCYKDLNQKDSIIEIKVEQIMFDCDSPTLRQGNPAESSIRFLSLLSIVKQIEKSTNELYGCSSFPVQISQQLKNFVEETDMANLEQLEHQRTLKSKKKSFNLTQQQKRNCWLEIKHNKIFLLSINLQKKILQISYENIKNIQTYATCIILSVRNMEFSDIKLKTTSSYYIRQILVYYRNYNRVYQQMCRDQDLCNSVISVSREQLIHSSMEETEEVML